MTVRAMILAAGRGERMRPLTDATPKSLLRAGGKPLIVWTIERFARAGIKELVINHAYHGEQIVRALGDGSQWGVRIAYSAEAQALETAGGIANALALLGDGPFVVTAADVFSDIDFGRLAARAAALERSGDLAHLVLVPNPDHHPRGDFVLEGDRVSDEGALRVTYAATGLFSPRLFAGVPPGTRAQLAPLLREAMAAGRVSGELHRGEWRDIGTPERLAELDCDLAKS